MITEMICCGETSFNPCNLFRVGDRCTVFRQPQSLSFMMLNSSSTAPPPTSLVNGIRQIDSATVQHPTIGTFAVYSLSESCLLPPVILHFEWLGTDVHLDVPYLRAWDPQKLQDSYLKSRGFDSHPGLKSWRLWHDFARGEFRIPMKWPVFRFFFWGGGSSECNDMAFTSAIFSEARHVRPWSWWSKHTTKAMDIPGADAQNGGRMGGVSGFRMSRKGWGCFFWFDGFTSGDESLPGWKAVFGMDFWKHSTAARRAREESQVSSQELPNDASWVLTLCISKSWFQLTTFANQLGTMNQSPKKQWMHTRIHACCLQPLVMKWSYQLSDVISYHKLQWS